ncbi:hypothetical protein AB6N24_17390 [Cellulomonas sp. 179-A 4D5 NHS]|uniref:hypothetical protein n=1 Tax=Cellulomonas sp. 179-A 4D5 NHS TaxID=3142378 RepID=UPI0039A06503
MAAVDTVQHLGTEHGYRFFESVLEKSDDARTLHGELTALGLEAQPERTQLFSVFSPDSLQSIAISVTPFSSKDQTQEGGLSVSEGGHAQAVVVDIKDRTTIAAFEHLALQDGQVVRSKHDTEELTRGREGGKGRASDGYIRELAERVGKVPAGRHLVEIEARQVRSLASVSYNTLLGDDFSQSVHDKEEITALQGSTRLVAEIGLFVLFRTSGSACCSCSCSCWGSSSCSCSYAG